MVCCRHATPDYLVLEFNRKPVEGEDAIVLFVCKGKHPSKHIVGRERSVELSNNVCLCSGKTYKRKGSIPIVVAVYSRSRAIKDDSKGRFPLNACTGAVASHYCS